MATLNVDEHSGVPPITRESFLAAFVDAAPFAQCRHAAMHWAELHSREMLGEEIDEDP